jgi:phosphatidylserine decarboxylase
LERVAAEFVLVVAGGPGTFAAFEIVATKEMENVGGLEVGEFVRLAVLIDEKGEVDAGFLLKYAGVVCIAEADGR